MKNIIILIVFVFCATCSYADWLELEKIFASDTDYYDYFGNSVSISEDYALIGAPYDDDNGSHSGSAYIFFFDGSNWIEQAKLTATDGAEGDQFGYSVSISNGYAVIGALMDDDNGDRSGSAYIFKRNGTSWVEQTKLTASDGTSYDQFGYSVSISENYAIIGAPCYDYDDSGSAYIFEYNGISWIEQVKLTASDAAEEDFFGIAVSISGDYTVIGAAGDDDSGDRSGSAYIFFDDGINWIEQTKLIASDSSEYDLFGNSVSIDGEYALIGALFDDNGFNNGSAYIFEFNGTCWIENAKITVDDTTAGSFSNSVSIDENYAIIGAPTDSEYAEAAGAAYIFYNEVVSANDDTPNYSMQIEDFSNYPNPFNPTTTISFNLTTEIIEDAELIIYNLKGQKIRVFDVIPSGVEGTSNQQVVWNGTDQNNQPVSSGIYFYKLRIGDFEMNRKMLLLK